jgi:hypothetical protein
MRIFFFVLFNLALICCVFAGDEVYTNEDLEKYNYSSGTTFGGRNQNSTNAINYSDLVNQNGSVSSSNYDYWCNMGSKCQSRVDRARDRVIKAQETLSETESKVFATKGGGARLFADKKDTSIVSAERNLEAAQNELSSAEQDLTELNDTSRQANIPSGWVRCQRY